MRPREAAEIIGCGATHVTHLIRTGKLRARAVPSDQNRHGYVWEITQREAERYRDAPVTVGYPRGRKRN